MMYFEKDDVLHLAISDEPEAGSVELGPNITVELNDKGDMIGIEILEASHFIRDSIMTPLKKACSEARPRADCRTRGRLRELFSVDSIMESVQAKVLRVPEFQPA